MITKENTKTRKIPVAGKELRFQLFLVRYLVVFAKKSQDIWCHYGVKNCKCN